MAFTNLDIAQGACVLVGIDAISSFTQGTTEANLINENYEDFVEAELSLYPFRFAMKQQALDRLSDTPAGRWDAAYQIPGDCLLVRALTVNDKQIEFDRYDDMIYCDAGIDDVVVMDYTYRPDEALWSKSFVAIIKHRLCAALASGVAQMPDIAKVHEDKAEHILIKARHMDSSSQTTRRLRPTRLVNRRRGV